VGEPGANPCDRPSGWAGFLGDAGCEAFLNADTPIDDGVADVLFGDSRKDWFLAFPGDHVVDRKPGR
jgi:hypothetical protein